MDTSYYQALHVYSESIFACETVENENEQFIPEEHISSENFEILDNNKYLNSDEFRTNNYMPMPIPKPAVGKCGEDLQCIYVLYSLMFELQSLNLEHEKLVDNIKNLIVELGNT